MVHVPVSAVLSSSNVPGTPMAFRVPTPTVSAVDLTVKTVKETSYKETSKEARREEALCGKNEERGADNIPIVERRVVGLRRLAQAHPSY